MHGIRRVFVFCTLITILPTMLLVIPLYLRHSFYADVAYAVTESDIMEINDGISTLFCSKHTLQMNNTFNAFQMAQRPEIASYRKHIRLKKSMNLPDDTLEYWGFYLLKGATVALSVCSRFQGASILVVKGERNLRTCGLLEHNIEKEQTQQIFLPGANRQVKIIYESNAQEIDSNESTATNAYDIDNTYKTFVNVSLRNPLENDTTFLTRRDNETQANDATLDKENLEALYRTASSYVRKHTRQREKTNDVRKLRHVLSKRRRMKKRKDKRARQGSVRRHTRKRKEHLQKLKRDLYSYSINRRDQDEGYEETRSVARFARSQDLVNPPSLLDQGIRHGGNAGKNTSDVSAASSISSFETGLFNCYGGAILLAHEFEPSDQCSNISYLIGGRHTQTSHNVEEDGYYYYIFYSDNDFVSNDIYALFDIYKPTFQYENVTKSCINQTACSFSLSLMSPDRVIVEIPTRDGIDHEIDDISMLISICHPRMGAYIIFPIAVLFLILSCAFV